MRAAMQWAGQSGARAVARRALVAGASPHPTHGTADDAGRSVL